MRYRLIALTGCAGTPVENARTVQRCTSSECFRPSDIRRVEALDDATVIVYVGARECPYRVDVRGVGCRLDFALDLSFLQREPGSPITGNAGGYRAPGQVCAFTPRVEIFTGINEPGTGRPIAGSRGSAADPFGQVCRVSDVDAMTDDELVELYVDRGVTPPPPPMGNGQLQTPEQDGSEQDDSEQDDSEQDAAGGEQTPAGGPESSESGAAATGSGAGSSRLTTATEAP